MKISHLLRQSLPHLVAIILYVVIALFFFAPVSFDNKVLVQNDILQGAGATQEIVEFREQVGEEPLWSNSMFSGMPAYLLSLEFPGDWTSTMLGIIYLGLPHPPKLVFVAMLSFYILLLCSGVRSWLAVAGGTAYGLSTFLMISIEAGHNSKVVAMVLMPLVIAGVLLTLKGRQVWGFVLTAFGLALHLRAGHLQITYYLLLTLIVLGIVWLIQAYKLQQLPSFFKNIGLLVLAALLAVGCNWGRLYSIYSYGKFSNRAPSELTSAVEASPTTGARPDREYAFRWSSGFSETFTLLVPYFYGGASSESIDADSELAETLSRQGVAPAQAQQFLEQVPTYFGDQPGTAGPVYVGAVICFLFVLGLLLAPAGYRYWLLAATVLALILSWGSNLEGVNYFLFDYLPGYNKFRAVTMSVAILLLTMPLLGFIGVEYFWRQAGTKEARKALFIAAGVTGGLALLFGLFAGMRSYTGPVDAQLAGYPDWILSAIRDQREALVRADAFRSFFFILLAAGAAYLVWLRKLTPILGSVLIGLLLLVDLWAVDARYLDESNYSRDPRRQFFAQTDADQVLLADQDPHFRVLNLMNPFNEARTSYYHRSIGGYHGAKLRRYQDLIERAIQPEIQTLITSLQSGAPDFEEADVLNMLDTRYLLAGQQREAVIRNPAALGAAWLVQEVERVQTADAEIAALQEIDTRTTAVVNTEKFPLQQQNYSGTGSIQLLQYEPNHIVYEATTSGEALAVFSDIYYPEGWVATVNGEPADILQSNFVLRALELPAGTHTIEFKFVPTLYATGNLVMLICNVILVLLLIGAIFWSFRNKKKTDQEVVA